MSIKTFCDLTDICESIYTNKPITEEKDNPFSDENKEDKEDGKDVADDETEDDEDGSEDDAQDTGDDTGDDDSDVVNSMFGGNSEDKSEDESKPEDETEGKTEDDGDEVGSEYSISSEEYSDVSDFGITVMMLATQVHFWHINCTTASVHTCLQDLYENLEKSADALLENIISVTKAPVNAGNELSFDFGSLDFEIDDTIDVLEDVRSDASDLVKRYEDNQGLCNILADISETIGTAIYKLSRFED